MQSRLLPLTMCFALGVSLSACGHFDDRMGGEHMVQVGSEATVAHGDGPALHAWSAPTVIPVALQGPHAVADTDGPYLLDTGDRLRIFVYGQPNLSRIYVVDHGGWITVPLIGGVKVRGLTTFDLERKLKGKLGAQYVKDPHVTVDMHQNRPFFILGEVKTAGQFPYVSGMTIKTAVAIAGGFSERANERKFQITRRINGLVEKLDVPDDYVVLPGDTVQVYERFF
ncbi:MAG: polysaccharide biosynthesis/export family protein [Hyphomicrobiaceae bacterium]